MDTYKKIGVIFAAAGLTLTGTYLVNSESQRIRADDVVAVIGSAVERDIPYLSGNQCYTNATVSGAVPSPHDSVHLRPFYGDICTSLQHLRRVIARGLQETPFEVSNDTGWISDGAVILSNEFDEARNWVSYVPLETAPRGIPDRLNVYGHADRNCIMELVGAWDTTCLPWGLSDTPGARSRWQLMAGLDTDYYAHELASDKFSLRILKRDIRAAENVITNTNGLIYYPRPPLEILPGSYYLSGSTERLRTKGSAQAAINAALATWSDGPATEIKTFSDVPSSPSVFCEVSQFMDYQDFTVYASRDNNFKLSARLNWPCRQAVEAGKIGSVAVYVVYSLPWNYESYADTDRRINTAFDMTLQPANIGLPDLKKSPLPNFGIVTAKEYTAGRPRVYVAAQVMRQLNPRAWPLQAFTIDTTGWAIPTRFPDNTAGPGQLTIRYEIHGFFAVAWFIPDHKIIGG